MTDPKTDTPTDLEGQPLRAAAPLAIRQPERAPEAAPSLLAPLPPVPVGKPPAGDAATRFRCSEKVGDLMSALAKAQGEIEPAMKESENNHTHKRYADLASVWKAIRKPLSKHGLAVVQPIVDGHLVTRVHFGEQWIESEVKLALDTATGRTPVQALGSAITYLRRYTLSTLVGVAPDDDDDGHSDGRGYPQQHQQRRAS